MSTFNEKMWFHIGNDNTKRCVLKIYILKILGMHNFCTDSLMLRQLMRI